MKLTVISPPNLSLIVLIPGGVVGPFSRHRITEHRSIRDGVTSHLDIVQRHRPLLCIFRDDHDTSRTIATSYPSTRIVDRSSNTATAVVAAVVRCLVIAIRSPLQASRATTKETAATLARADIGIRGRIGAYVGADSTRRTCGSNVSSARNPTITTNPTATPATIGYTQSPDTRRATDITSHIITATRATRTNSDRLRRTDVGSGCILT